MREVVGSPTVTLRRGTPEDCRRIWEWRNKPETRRASFDMAPIEYPLHKSWYHRVLRDPTVTLFVILNESETPIGYVRLEAKIPDVFIHISVDPAERGKGYGVNAIRSACRLALKLDRIERVVALVKVGNDASRKAFERAGFVLALTRRSAEGEVLEFVYRDSQKEPRQMLFRVDASAKSGLGHFQRCCALAKAFAFNKGLSACFLSDGDPGVERHLSGLGFQSESMNGIERGGPSDLLHTLAISARYRCEGVVVDSYHVDAAYLLRLRAAGLFVMAIDDLGRFPFPCQLVVSPGAHARNLSYRSSSGDTRFLLGPAYALLRPEFWNPPRRSPRPRVQEVLVMLGGGSDPHHLMPGLLGLLEQLQGEFSVTAILGPFFKNPERIRSLVKRLRRPVCVVESPTQLVDYMVQADLAITAGGQSLYELACVGCPTVAIEVAENQRAQLKALAGLGAVQFAGRAGDPRLLSRVSRLVNRLRDDEQLQDHMSLAGQQLVDGRGALRVAEEGFRGCGSR